MSECRSSTTRSNAMPATRFGAFCVCVERCGTAASPGAVRLRLLSNPSRCRGRIVGRLALVLRVGPAALVAGIPAAPRPRAAFRYAELRPVRRPRGPGGSGADRASERRVARPRAAAGPPPADPAEWRVAQSLGPVRTPALTGRTSSRPERRRPRRERLRWMHRREQRKRQALHRATYATSCTVGVDGFDDFPSEMALVPGLELHEIRADPFTMVVPERGAFRDRAKGVRTRETRFQGTASERPADGEIRRFRIGGVPLRDPAGHHLGRAGMKYPIDASDGFLAEVSPLSMVRSGTPWSRGKPSPESGPRPARLARWRSSPPPAARRSRRYAQSRTEPRPARPAPASRLWPPCGRPGSASSRRTTVGSRCRRPDGYPDAPAALSIGARTRDPRTGRPLRGAGPDVGSRLSEPGWPGSWPQRCRRCGSAGRRRGRRRGPSCRAPSYPGRPAPRCR